MHGNSEREHTEPLREPPCFFREFRGRFYFSRRALVTELKRLILRPSQNSKSR